MTGNEMNTEILIQKAKMGNTDAFTELMKLQMQTMYRTAKAILMNDEDVSDAIQETLLTCWEKLNELKTDRYFKTWMTKIYSGQSVAIAADTRTIYLPQKSLSDEELLEIIDFNHKMTYSIYEKNQERILAQGNWESRMAEMTDSEVDRIYPAYCASNLETGGGFSRVLRQEENQRYEELNEQYENEGLYPETELNLIKTADEYTGIGAAFCEENSTYYIPDGAASDFEFLQIIDFNHKISYCFDRIHYEIMMGFREDYPKAE